MNTSFAMTPTNNAPIDKSAEEAATRSPFTSYVVLLSGMHKAVQDNEPPGSRPGVYLFAKRKLLESFLAIPAPISFRPRATFNPSAASGLQKVESNVPGSPDWKKVEDYKKSKKSEIKAGRPKLGVEALLWLPDENDFAIIALQNSARKATSPLAAIRDKKTACRIRSKKESFTQDGNVIVYFVPVIDEVVLDRMPAFPTQDRVDEAVSQFQAYKGEEPAEDEAAER